MSWLHPTFNLWSNIIRQSRDMGWEMSEHLPTVMNASLSILLSKAMRRATDCQGTTIFPGHRNRSSGHGLFCVYGMQTSVLQSSSLSLSIREKTRQHVSPQSGIYLSCTRANPMASEREGEGWHVWPEKQSQKPLWKGTWLSHVKLRRSVYHLNCHYGLFLMKSSWN